MQGGGSRENGKPHPVLWHSVPLIASSSASSSHPVSISPSQYIGITPGSSQPPPMGFPSFINLESPPMRSSPTLGLDTLRSSALPVVPSTPAYASYDTHLLQHPHLHPRSSLPSGLKEPVVSSITGFPSASSRDLTSATVLPRFDKESLDIPMPSPSTMQRDINALDPTDPKHVGDQSFPISSGISASTNLLSLNPSTGSSDPPPVPESFPRNPVPQSGRGEGWPYAPQGWPKPDDKWGWRVGKRASSTSLWIDRYVTLPTSLLKGRRTVEFASKKSLMEYCKQNFPQMTDPSSIFKAFDWKVPAPKDFKAPEPKDIEVPEKRGPAAKRDKPPPVDGDDNRLKSKRQCRAGNPDCILTKAKDSGSESLGSLVCHICCSEPSFCRECKCILCCEFFRPNADDFSVVRCLNLPVPGQGICGHAAHLECALNSQLAGVIKKNGLDMEYICRRCDRKTDLRETVSQLVEVMGKNATQFTVESSLQLALRTVQDPEDEAPSPGKTPATLLADALKKVQEGAVIIEVYKELIEQLNGLQAGRSRATGRERALEDSPHLSEANLDKLAPHFMSVGSPAVPIISSTFQVQKNSQSKPPVSTQQGGSNDASLALASTVCHGGDGVAITSGTSLQAVLNVEPSDLLLCIPSLSSRLNQSVCKPPTLSIEDHIRQCEAMTDRVKGAGQLNTPLGTLKVLSSDSKPPSLTAHLSTSDFQDSHVVEASQCRDSPYAGELVISLSSSSGGDSGSLSNSQGASGDTIANTRITEDAVGDCVVSAQVVEVPSVEPVTTIPSLAMTHAAGLEAEYEGQISEALEKLKWAQASEYASAEESLNVQKKIVIEQYRNILAMKENGQVFPHQLLKDQRDKSRAEIDCAMNPLLAQFENAKEGFESMLAISNGFGQVSKEFLRQFFNWPQSDTAEA